MIINLPNNRTAKLIGDPHLGLKFEVNVPIHRRGEREKSQWADFLNALDTPGVDYNIMVGDLFEHPFVSHSTAINAADAFLAAAKKHTATTFIAMAGNHDRPRNTDVKGAWESFYGMTHGRRGNLLVVNEPAAVGGMLILPWQWGVPAAEQVERFAGPSLHTAIGHYDLKSFGGEDSHLYPTKALAKFGIENFYGGHYHTAGIYQVQGHYVTCTGSLQPYSHGEDPEESIYVTRTLAEVLENPEAFKDKCIRVVLEPGEELPEIDCLAIQPMKAEVEAVEIPEVQMDGFDWDKVLEHELARVEDKEVVSYIKERLS